MEALRRDIERLTKKLLEVAAERADVVRRIALEKAAAGMPMRDRAREEELMASSMAMAPAPLTAQSARRIVQSVIEVSVEALGEPPPRESAVSRTGGRPVEVLGMGEDLPPVWIMGPCTVESLDQMAAVAAAARSAGARILRGGAFKTRTSPQSFQGLGRDGLRILREVADRERMAVVTEATGVGHLEAVAESADAIQIGSRNAQSPELLDAAGRVAAAAGKGVILKRGFGCTVAEWISAAEYVAVHTESIVLCERGIRTFETGTRFTLDVAAVPLARALTRLPVIIDPSHAAGRRDMVAPLAAAGLAAGADGVMLEVHPDPDRAISDAEQQIIVDQLPDFMETVRVSLHRASAWR